MTPENQKIFVSIAAYRDRDCVNTINSLFAKARWPDAITVGLCWQYLSPDDDDCQVVGARPQQCRVLRVPIDQAGGVCWARHQVQHLWRGEAYVLQIDSHMRFVDHWDDKMLAMLRQCPSPKPILSNYPAAFTPPEQIESHIVSVIYAAGFNEDGIVVQNSVGHPPEAIGPLPQSTPFCAGGFIFGPSAWIGEVPYDPLIYFLGEEISLAVRLFTHGWDIFVPTDVLLYHDYNNHPDRPRHWKDRADWNLLNQRSLKRVRHLLAGEISDDAEALRDLGLYGLGTSRSLADYQAFAGLDFAGRTVNGQAPKAESDTDSPEAKRRRHGEVFTRIWQNNSWGAVETRSGCGSTLAATASLRAQLSQLFTDLNLRRLIDAGCGDIHWMKEISAAFELYLGLDVVAPLIAQLESRYSGRRGHFFLRRDVTLDDLPKVDAILCRDVLTHLPLAEVSAALRQFRASGSAYLIATSHATGSNREIGVGDWQPLDLQAPPFSLPKPFLTLIECPGQPKTLAVWRREQLKFNSLDSPPPAVPRH